MTQIVDTNVAAVKMSGSFSLSNFSSGEEEMDEEINHRMPRSNVVSRSNLKSMIDRSVKTANSDKTQGSLSKVEQKISLKSTANSNCVTSISSVPFTSGSSTPQPETVSYAYTDDTPSVTAAAVLKSKAVNLSHSAQQSVDRNSVTSLETQQSSSSPMMVNRSGLHCVAVNSSQYCASDASSGSSRDLYYQSRFNPFDHDIHMEEDHFCSSSDNLFGRNNSSPHSTVSDISQWNDDGELGEKNDNVTLAELGLSEDHFSHPEGHFGLSQTEELQMAIENCKDLIRKATANTERQRSLVRRLVQLRLKLQEMKDEPTVREENVMVVMGHRFQRKESRSSKYYCEKCNSLIWGLVQEWRKCVDCGFKCHEKCTSQVTRNCAMVKVKENPSFILDICPRNPTGVAAQNYRCAECKALIAVADGVEPRLCEYNGHYYCEMCHWNDLMYIPAQILLNWDFEKRKVCRASKQFLKLMMMKAVINVQEVNPLLFNYVEQLNDIKNLREELLMMKKYIMACPTAMQAKLLLQLSSRPHFVECSDRYSLQDLLDSDEALVPHLVQVHSSWARHIKTDCELCRGRGHCCELCTNNEVLFPFDNIAIACSGCSAVMHRICFAQYVMCPKCERRRKRQEEPAKKPD